VTEPTNPGAGGGRGPEASTPDPSVTERGSTPHPVRHRRFSLRARLIALVLLVVAAALVAVDVVIPLTTRSALIAGKDRTLTSVVDSLPGHMHLDQALAQVSQTNPLAGDIGWSQVTLSGAAKVLQVPAGQPQANPAVGARPPTGSPVTVGDADGSGGTYRILAAAPLSDGFGRPAGYVVAWIPLADVRSTIGRLVLLEVLISLGLLVLVGGTAGFVVRRELRPLETMARAADEIAAGDLSRRVDPGAPGTEVGRLGTAFNGMVDGVSNLLAERAESERRMRQFVADASHELRTPVAAIRGYTDLYRAGALPEEVALDRAMDRMGFESQRMGSLVEDLLTLTHTDAETAAPTEPVDLVPLLTGAVDDAAVIDRGRTWRLAGTATRAVVLGDRLRLHQLFANLLANVRTHTPVGTTATVSVTANRHEVAVAVIDDGPGVADADLSRLFDRFFRADASRSRERGGSGLGLSIAAAIVRTHRGRIHATPTPGGGLTVTVVLPAAPLEEDAGAAEPDTEGSATPSHQPSPAADAPTDLRGVRGTGR
jgi:two-component system OmpR family sensor kinase